MTSSTQVALAELRQKMQSYAPLSDQTWQAMREICRTQMLPKGTYWLKPGQQPDRFAFVHRGLLRIYVTDGQGREYNKMFFAEGSFPGSMAALLEKRQSDFGLQALEDTCLLEIDFAAYRSLLQRFHDLALYQVHYLETNWLRAKDVREVALVQEDAASRYTRFMDEFGYLAHRLPQYHIASHLGITPTQLSRIKKAGIINLCK
ncbi:hypothetical protein GCM10009092_03360 [Bowmanella denitrificans]|uniref:Cyclic nucleotide-binding domain-containing protein n=1 Tax=Bowmanella denitrificans TaxID=366582 RepID=A0ABP3GCJ9_9ALTE|nr:Crp/Fnr family transcriptional regulator [Bowmanella denitrificans]